MTRREVAGPQVSPLNALQFESRLHLVCPRRHMREPVVLLAELQPSPMAPGRQRLTEAPVQGLAFGTQGLVSLQVLSVYVVVQACWVNRQALLAALQVLPEKLQVEKPKNKPAQFAVVVHGTVVNVQVPPQSLTVVQVRAGLSEQTLAPTGQVELVEVAPVAFGSLQPPAGVTPVAQVPPVFKYGQSLLVLHAVVLLAHIPFRQSLLVEQVTLLYLHFSVAVHLLFVLQELLLSWHRPLVWAGQSVSVKQAWPVAQVPALG
jgi:hypothetical protein